MDQVDVVVRSETKFSRCRPRRCHLVEYKSAHGNSRYAAAAREFLPGLRKGVRQWCLTIYAGQFQAAGEQIFGHQFKPERGIVKFAFRVSNQDGVAVLNYLDTVMFARRPA